MSHAPSSYLRQRRPQYELRARTVVPASVGDVFDFFSRPQNLGVMTPAKMGFLITSVSGPMEEGALITYRIRIAGIPLTWKTRIEAWDPGQRFVDAQLSGPYACWWHEHRFSSDGASSTIMEDRVLYAPPLGPLGRIANRLTIENELRGIFAVRAEAIELRFGTVRASEMESLAS